MVEEGCEGEATRLADIRVYAFDDRDQLVKREFGDLAGMLGPDLEIAFLGRADVEDFVLLFQPQVLAVDVDDQQRVAAFEQFLRDDLPELLLPALLLPVAIAEARTWLASHESAADRAGCEEVKA